MRSAGSSRTFGSAIGPRQFRLVFRHPTPPSRGQSGAPVAPPAARLLSSKLWLRFDSEFGGVAAAPQELQVEQSVFPAGLQVWLFSEKTWRTETMLPPA